ncbi:ribose 5-phosphate isomerase B [Fuerstiella marisgermanici]|uniref:Sugar phosphate isomerase YwlF n=1 Tax=Fuerstiella marisgermanici TaxID=1891926 RepID=A0A1P8WCR7_9PLAN|nr:ribose 5-phosphate isomerase B [Fuerstiella marisgermanici]APZ91856.1 Putative sugar phosphate isomerase YwlF [Fuerstiella marisgermanici]
MRIAIASDHRGFQMKNRLIQLVQSLGHDVTDFGPDSTDSVDYPDFAQHVCEGITSGDYDRGVLICGTGIGMCITANKFDGIRAANCNDSVTAEYSRLHNDVNVVCLSADQLSDQLADQILQIWLKAEFEGGRHARRLDKIAEIEKSPSAELTPGA